MDQFAPPQNFSSLEIVSEGLVSSLVARMVAEMLILKKIWSFLISH
jgi:hypothetical protein